MVHGGPVHLKSQASLALAGLMPFVPVPVSVPSPFPELPCVPDTAAIAYMHDRESRPGPDKSGRFCIQFLVPPRSIKEERDMSLNPELRVRRGNSPPGALAKRHPSTLGEIDGDRRPKIRKRTADPTSKACP